MIICRQHLTLAGLLFALLPAGALAHGGEDHGADAHASEASHAMAPQTMAVSSPLYAEPPRRLADGRVFLPKSVQRRLGIRTQIPHTAPLTRSLELNGHVVMDPNAGGRVQSLQGGRLVAGPNGLPTLGQAVSKGEVLARILPAVSPLDLATQQAELADWQEQRKLAQKDLARLRALDSAVPRREIEAAEAQLRGLAARIRVLEQGLARLEPLVAPVEGVIASTLAVNGQVVDAKETLFEVIDPRRLLIEAFAFDPQVAATISGASLQGSGLPLTLMGSGRALREGALPLLFRVQSDALAPALVLGQPVKLIAQTREPVAGVALPLSALVQNSVNEPVIWVHEEPELFRAWPVQAAPLNGTQRAVTGLPDAARVVVQGATLLNQIR